MTFNETAAAYGLFQVVFADVADHLAVATFMLRERREPGLVFETVFRQEFTKTLKQFRRELREFENRPSVSESLYDLREACEIMAKLVVWRNDRIHARVRLTEQGYALYDWRTRYRLEISEEQSEKNIHLAIKVNVALEGHIDHLIHLAKWEEEFNRLFSTLPEFSEDEDKTRPE